MVIDFHTHIFPDKIAEKTIKFLEEEGNIKAYTDGTLNGLKRSMLDNNIDISVVMPVVTKPSQFNTVNEFAAQITGREGLISFGGLHPDTQDYRSELKRIKELGLPGIKMHPDYQKTFIDDPKMVQIIQYSAELGLIVLIHAGLDIGLLDPVHCPPKRTAKMLSQIEDEKAKIVLAHMGGYAMWEEVEEYLVGRNVYLDTSYAFGKLPDEQFIRIIRNHGADRILFSTDSPWGGQKESFDYIKRMDLTDEELERILHINAEELLGLR